MDFEKLYQEAQTKLSDLKSKQAVLDSQISQLADKLNLDKTQDLKTQALDLKKSLESSIAEVSSRLEGVLSELESLKTSSDESESFE